jgi:hypothetical protein
MEGVELQLHIFLTQALGCAIAQAVLSPLRLGFDAGFNHVKFVLDKLALVRFSQSASISSANSHSTLICHHHRHHSGLVQ